MRKSQGKSIEYGIHKVITRDFLGWNPIEMLMTWANGDVFF